MVICNFPLPRFLPRSTFCATLHSTRRVRRRKGTSNCDAICFDPLKKARLRTHYANLHDPLLMERFLHIHTLFQSLHPVRSRGRSGQAQSPVRIVALHTAILEPPFLTRTQEKSFKQTWHVFESSLWPRFLELFRLQGMMSCSRTLFAQTGRTNLLNRRPMLMTIKVPHDVGRELTTPLGGGSAGSQQRVGRGASGGSRRVSRQLVQDTGECSCQRCVSKTAWTHQVTFDGDGRCASALAQLPKLTTSTPLEKQSHGCPHLRVFEFVVLGMCLFLNVFVHVHLCFRVFFACAFFIALVFFGCLFICLFF